MKVWMIKRKSDGLFSMGGMFPRFKSVGKIWNSLGHIKSHLRQSAYNRQHAIEWEVVEYEVTEKGINPANFYL